MYSAKQFPAGDFRQFKLKVLNWLQQFGTFCFLDSHHYKVAPHAQECLAGAGVRREIAAPAGNALEALEHFITGKNNEAWLFGHLAYDLKNELAGLYTAYENKTGFPDMYFFEPETVIRFSSEEVYIRAADPDRVWEEINQCPARAHLHQHKPLTLSNRQSREEYLKIIRQLQEHIRRGDCYEINYCQEFYAEQKGLDPLQLYQRLGEISPSPFSAFYRRGNAWLMSASPERFLLRQGERLIAQPIKGTSPRFAEDAADEQSRLALLHSEKDRAENVMIVDLMRNDLSRVCRQGTVGVDELFGIYSYPQVHQMISTVSGSIDPSKTFTDIIRACFPMGSMTGAPKYRVMELIDQYEKMRRGIFSGAVGYIEPGGNFDFNVVIRSLLYNAETGYLSAPAGSAITFYSDADKEWDECLLKIKGLNAVLSA